MTASSPKFHGEVDSSADCEAYRDLYGKECPCGGKRCKHDWAHYGSGHAELYGERVEVCVLCGASRVMIAQAATTS